MYGEEYTKYVDKAEVDDILRHEIFPVNPCICLKVVP